jgi:predicted transcriptional regulator
MRATLEHEVLRVLWSAAAPRTVREVLERVNAERDRPLAYTTVMTVLRRLTDKGAAVRHESGARHRYEATARDEVELAVLRLLADHGDAALAHILRSAATNPVFRRRLQSVLGTAHPAEQRATRPDPTEPARPWTDVYFGPDTPPAPPGTDTGDNWTRWIAG